MMDKIQSLYSWDTEYSADSLEWCPIQKFHDVFVCGTYKLEQNSGNDDSVNPKCQQRIGRLYLFVCQNVEPYLLKKQDIEMPAVLDCKWCPVPLLGKVLLAVANAKGKICIYELCTTENGDCSNGYPKLVLLVEKELPTHNAEDKLSLSIDWSVGINCCSYNQISLAVSDSKGCISIFLLNDNSLELQYHWKAHEFEAWIVSYNYSNTNVIYTGGDDCRLCVYDTRCTDSPVLTSRLHSAGITSMHYSTFSEYLFVSGSYDENIFIWDTRQMKRNIGSVNVGGGVWRLKWEPSKGQHLLAACMYNGFCVLDAIDKSDPKIVAEFNEHESLAYGADWCHGSKTFLKEKLLNFISSNKLNLHVQQTLVDLKLIGTCSFYDHKLCVSTFISSNDKLL
ncbi:diphthine methyltransferase [Lycorma delicatula]|uniref:diphthine methyltransferase n=1 Tax=Lycorma delicatula TaxID=130591 RepID=UPI003F51972D